MSENLFKNQIKNERRRRNQSYQSLDYMLSRITYFDFFSADAFNIAKHSKYFTQLFGKNVVTSEFLLFPSYFTLVTVVLNLTLLLELPFLTLPNI